LIITYFITS